MEIKAYSLVCDMKPVKFHPYASYVQERIFTMEYDSQDQEIFKLKKALIDLFTEAGIKAYVDNKIVFEVEIYGRLMYYGFYDGRFSIGFSVWSR